MTSVLLQQSFYFRLRNPNNNTSFFLCVDILHNTSVQQMVPLVQCVLSKKSLLQQKEQVKFTTQVVYKDSPTFQSMQEQQRYHVSRSYVGEKPTGS